MSNRATLHRTHAGRRIVVTEARPPIPVRGFDYCAHFEDAAEDSQQGWGSTREEAIGALIELVYPEESE